MSTGRLANLERALKSERAVLAYVDLTQTEETLEDVLARATSEPITHVYHLAAAPARSDRPGRPWASLAVHGSGTMQLLKLAERRRARFVLASDVDEHVEGKRFAEALTLAARTELGVDARIVRLSECYGPRMPLDGEGLAATLLRAALGNVQAVLPAAAAERRSLSYVADVVAGIELLAAASADEASLVNVFSPATHTVAEIVERFSRAAALERAPVYGGGTPSRPGAVRDGDACDVRPGDGFGWQPQIGLDAGIARTCEWFRAAARHYALV